MQCEGNCDEHRGEVKQVTVIDPKYAHLTEFVEIYDKIMDEKCPSDEKHCTCVPFLKVELRKRDALLIAARQLGRKAVGIEIEEKYCQGVLSFESYLGVD